MQAPPADAHPPAHPPRSSAQLTEVDSTLSFGGQVPLLFTGIGHAAREDQGARVVIEVITEASALTALN